MTKEQLQQELKEKIRTGIKPSDLKKLKRSKSAGDLPNPPQPKSVPLTRTNSTQKSILELKLETKDRELQEKEETIRELNQDLSKTKQELDNSLSARVEAVKQFGTIYEKLKLVRKELNENVDYASDELITADDKVSSLRTKLFTASQQISSLQKDLELAQRLAKLKKYPLPDNNNN